MSHEVEIQMLKTVITDLVKRVDKLEHVRKRRDDAFRQRQSENAKAYHRRKRELEEKEEKKMENYGHQDMQYNKAFAYDNKPIGFKF